MQKQPNQQIPPLRKPDGTWAKSDKENTMTFGKYLEEVFQPLPSSSTEEDEVIYKYLKAIQHPSEQIKSLSTKKVKTT